MAVMPLPATTPAPVRRGAGGGQGRASGRQIAALALPATLALAADPLLSLVDTALVGRLGTGPLAALGICSAVFTTVFFLFNFLTYGTTAEIARLRGAGRGDEVATYALQALWLALGLGLAATLLLEVAAPLVLSAMGAAGEVRALALDYLRVRALAGVPVLVVMVGHGLFRGLADTRTPLVVAAAANVVNAVLSWALIYPAGLGVAGVALGTVIAQTGAAAAFLVLARRRLPTPGLRVDPAAVRRLARVSRDLFLRTASLLAGTLVVTAAAARMSTVTVAAHQILRELWFLLALVLDGLAIAGQTLVGTALGAGQPARARADARRLTWLGLVAGTVLGAVLLMLAGPLPAAFSNDPAVLSAARGVWVVVAALQVVGGVVFVLDGVLMGAGDYRFLLRSTVAAVLLGVVPLSLASLAIGWGLPGLWAAMSALMLLRLVALLWRLRRHPWIGRV